MMDDLTLIIDGQSLTGWTAVRVTRGIERCPNDFELEMTERAPSGAQMPMVKPGQACTVQLGNDTVIVGYVDRVMPMLSAREHMIRVIGRGKCADLVDCAALWPGGQISGASALAIAQKLAQPYGITVRAATDAGPIIPQFNVMLGESAFEIIERICRYSALLAYEEPDGNLLLARAGEERAAGALIQGVNVQSARAVYSMDQRYSEYCALLQSADTLADAGEGGNLLARAHDPGVQRARTRFIIAEAGSGGQDVAKKRVEWEAARRAGRSSQLHVTTDTWRDASGALWTPNTQVEVKMPALYTEGKTWVLAQVCYQRNTHGTTAELWLMPPHAFTPQPMLLQPYDADIPAFP
jgi:prophage tail gpP-like protein